MSSGGKSGNGKLFALVEWVSGPDQGKLTHNIRTTWVRDLPRPYDFDSTESYVIEWRVPPMPKTGWPVFDGRILDVSDDVAYLKRQMNERNENERNECIEHSERIERNERLPLHNTSSQALSPLSPAFIQKVVDRAVQSAIQSTPKRGLTSEGNKENNSSDKVLIGTSLYVDKHIYLRIKHAASPGAIVRPLLRQAFSKRRLIKSSYAGQKKIIRGVLVQKPGLKKYKKMEDIRKFVMERFPHITQSSFCLTVGRYLGEAANKKIEPEYIDESASEEEVEED